MYIYLLTYSSLCIHIHIYIYIYIYTSVNPCISMHGARQSRAMCNRVKCQRAQTPWTASSNVTTNAILSTASRLHAFATPQLRVFTSSRENESKFDLNLVTISIKIYLRNPFQNHWKIDPKSMKIGSWSHIGSRWHLLGAILAQDDPEDWVFIDF